MTNDGQNYKYVYDGFGRLRKVLNQGTPTPKVVEEFWYHFRGRPWPPGLMEVRYQR